VAARKRVGSFPRAQRRRPLVTYSLSPEAVAAIEELAQRLGISKSSVIELAVRALAVKHSLPLAALRAAIDAKPPTKRPRAR
jgi:hypothetical protein